MSKRDLTLLALIVLVTSVTFGQSVLLQPPKLIQAGKNPQTKIFYKDTSTVQLNWSKAITDPKLRFKIGSTSGNYTSASIPVSGITGTFKPKDYGLTVGRYYGVLTNADANSITGIINEYNASPSTKDYSNEIQLVVESPNAPVALTPKGTTTNSTPTFSWQSVPGVTAYWVIVSSTPFTIKENEKGDIKIEGANIVWDHITTQTSAKYGDISPSSPFTTVSTPLFAGNEYSYTIINLYDETSIAYASTVFGSVVAFTYQSSNVLGTPLLTSPAANTTINATNTIRFSWQSVPGANSYTVYLFNRVQQFAGSEQEVDVPVWNTTTTNTAIDFPARVNLTRGKYVWYIVATGSLGQGSASARNIFTYNVPTSPFRIEARSTVASALLSGYNVYVSSTTGGYSPSVPFIISDNVSYSDSLPSDIYQMRIVKSGYLDTTITQTLNSSSLTPITAFMRPYPATVSGKVVDENNQALSSALVSFRNNATNVTSTASSNSLGDFNLVLDLGTYTVTASKGGYIGSLSRSINIEQSQISITPNFSLRADKVTISGTCKNDNDQPVQLATVTATQGSVTHTVNSDGSGAYTLELSPGVWGITAEKTGFIAPAASTITLTTGNNILGRTILLTPRANTVSGIVSRVQTIAGQTSSTPFASVTVTATPSSGTPITTTTNNSGQFSFSLPSGTYTISTARANFTSSTPAITTLGLGETVSGLNLSLTPNPSSVTGTVLDINGNTIAGAEVFVQGITSTTTLQNGTYTLSMPTGTYTENVQITGYVSPSPRSISLSAGQTLVGIDFSLIPNAAVLRGTVISSGEPVVNATVTATAGANSSTVTTDNSGNYEFNLQPGTYSIVAFRSGFLSAAALTATISAGQTSSNNNFTLTANKGTIRGTIVSSSLPLSNALVTITDPNDEQYSATTLSNINGEYAVSLEAGKSYNLRFTAQGYNTVSLNAILVEATKETQQSITMSAAAASLSGTITDNNLKTISASLIITNALSGSFVDSLTTGANGLYSLGVSAGNYLLKSTLVGYRTDSISVTVGNGENLTGLNLKLNEDFATLTGAITESGIGIENALVTISSVSTTLSAQTSADGSYILTRIPAGTYNVKVEKSGYNVSNAITLLSGSETKQYSVALTKQTGTINGSVLTSGGTPVGEVLVIATSSGTSYTTLTKPDGTYSLTGLPFSVFDVIVSTTGYYSAQRDVTELSVATQTQTVIIKDLLAKTASITGSVKDDSGLPLKEASVSVSGTTGSKSVSSNADGSFVIDGITAGTYSLSANKDGYASFQINIDVVSTKDQAITLPINTATVTGVVTDAAGAPLNLVVPVKAVQGVRSLQTNTSLNGSFAFSGLENGKQYKIFSELQREGYQNDSVNVTATVGASANLKVNVSLGYLKGNIQSGSVLMLLENRSTGKITKDFSEGNGGYSFKFLPSGSYRLTPEKLGYLFTPASRDFTSTGKDTTTLDFTVSTNAGSADITVKTAGGSALNSVDVTLVSSVGSVVYKQSSANNGVASFPFLPVGTYVARTALSGYSSTPDSLVVTVAKDQNLSASFTLIENNINFSGAVSQSINGNVSALSEALVTMRRKSNGQSFASNTDAQGNFSLTKLPAGDFTFTVSKPGYVGYQEDITLNGSLSGKAVTLQSTVINLSGKVVYKGAGVKDLTVEAISQSVFSTKTNDAGVFSFSALPISAKAGDTTAYQIKITGTGISTETRIVKVPATQAGGTVSFEDVVLPSGRITFTFTDGSANANKISGVKVVLKSPSGTTTSAVTGSSGEFKTAENLRSGSYSASFEKQGYLLPGKTLSTVVLPFSTSAVERTIPLRYTMLDTLAINVGAPATVSVLSAVAIPTTANAVLYYKQKSATLFTAVAMSRSGSQFTANIQGINNTEEVTFYTVVTEDTVVYTSTEVVTTPVAVNVITQSSLDPVIDRVTLRRGDAITVTAKFSDGIGTDLSNFFKQAENYKGSIKWSASASSDSVSISFPNTDSLTAVITGKASGSYTITAIATLNNSRAVLRGLITVADVPLKSITVSGSSDKVSNRSKGVQFVGVAKDTSGKEFSIGNSLLWSIIPANAGSISKSGFYAPADTLQLGVVKIIATDNVTKQSSSFDLSVFAELTPGAATTVYTLSDKGGVVYSISAAAFDVPITLTITPAQFGPSKKYAAPVKSNESYVTSDRQFAINYTSNVGLPGDSLKRPASIRIPDDNSLRLFTGNKSIGYYDVNTHQWVVLNSILAKADETSASGNVVSNTAYKFGQYSLLVQNEPLGIKHFALLPAPFSPEVAPLKIGYFLNSALPPALVTIKIYNMEGELVRVVLENDMQMPGRYGSTTGIKEVLWDGLTDTGQKARNGRYIVHISATDGSGSVEEIKTLVLIK